MVKNGKKKKVSKLKHKTVNMVKTANAVKKCLKKNNGQHVKKRSITILKKKVNTVRNGQYGKKNSKRNDQKTV